MDAKDQQEEVYKETRAKRELCKEEGFMEKMENAPSRVLNDL